MQVHTFSGGCQGHPAITVLTDGKIVVTWHGKGATAEKGIWGRMFLVDGPPAGPVFHVNESAEDLQEAPAIAALSNGGFVIAWQEGGDDGTSADGSERGVYARLFNNSGQPSGNRFPVNSYTANDQKSADVAALNNGAFVVVWQSGENWDDGPDGSRGGIVFQLFGASGEKTGDEQIANSETDLDQMDPAVASLSDGSFVITWSSDEQDGSGLGIFGQRFDGSGNKDGLEFQINETTQHHQSSSDIAVFEDGEFAVVWRSIINPSPNIQRIYGRLYTSDGDAADSQFVIGPSVNGDINQAPAVAASEGDEWLVTWHGDSASLFGDNSDHGVLVQKYSGSEPLGETILSHTYMTGSQNYADAAYLPDGRIAVVWISYWQDGDCGGIYLQYLSADGEKIYPGPCTPQCDGKECGENGCGGFCGSCDDDVECTEDSCMDGSCTHSISQMYCLIDEVCVSSGTVNPLSSCDYCAPLSSPESWSTREDGYICGADMVCFQGSCCDVGANCEGKDCGDDGCGGICGECDPGQYCIKATCPPPGQQCDDGNEQIWDGCTNGEVTEFAVEIQASPGNVSAGTLSNKGFAIVYRAKSGGKPGDYNIAGRIFDSSGKNIKTLIPVNNETDGSQGGPGVVALEDKFFVFWEDSNEGSLGIFARPYDNSGNSLGSQFHVNSDSSGNGPPDATALESGNFIITWWISSSQNSDILGRWFDSDGAPASNSFYVIQKSQEKDAMPSVAPIANANVAIAWIRLNKTTGRGLAIYSRRFDIEGIPLEEPVLIDAFDQVNEPEAVSLPDGGYVVAWSRGSTQDIDLFGQKFTNDGSKSGGQFLINTTTDFNQGGITMAPQPNGFVAFWGSTQVDNGRVYGQLFNSNTGKVGGEFLAHVYIANKQVGPSVSSFSDGSFIVAWISWNQEGILQSAYAQRFDASGQKMYH